MSKGPRRTPTGIETKRHPGRVARVRLSLKLAFRWSVREKGRSALIAALIAVPVAGMAAVCLIAPSMVPTTAEKLAVDLGQTQAKVRVIAAPGSSIQQSPMSINGWGSSGDEPPADAEPLAPGSLFPAGTAMIPLLDASVTIQTANGVRVLPATVGESWDARLEGRFHIVSGQAPRGAGELLLTQGALERLGVGLGDDVRLVSPVDRSATVVGVLDATYQPDAAQTVFALPETLGMSDIASETAAMIYLPDTTLTWDDVRDLNRQGALALSRAVVLDPPPGDYFEYTGASSVTAIVMIAPLFFAFGVLEVVLLAGAAFLVGARSKERALATLASVGAPRSAVFGVISASGIVLGILGGLVGVAVGIAGGALFMALTDDGSATQYWGLHVWWPLFLAVIAAAALIGWLGALVPAVRASKVDVVAALRGSRIPPQPRKRHPITGIILVGAGLAVLAGGAVLAAVLERARDYTNTNPLTWIALGAWFVGPTVMLLGLLMCSGLLLRLIARMLSRMGVSARLASRDTARNSGRSVPAIAAIMVTVFVAVFAMTMVASAEATSKRTYHYRTTVGAVTVPLSYWSPLKDENTAIDDPEPYVDAMRRELDTQNVRVLQGVPDPQIDDGRGNLLTGVEPQPRLDLAADQLCPSDPQSPDYREHDAEINSDPRCQNYFFMGTFTQGWSHLWVGDVDDLALMLGRAPSAAAASALQNGEAVSLYDQYVDDGEVTISWWDIDALKGVFASDEATPQRSETIRAVVDKPEHPLDFGVIISPATADRLGLEYEDMSVVAVPEAPPTDAQMDALNGSLWALTGQVNSMWASVERGPTAMAGLFAWAILGLSAVIALGAAAVAIGLARADGKRDSATLWSVGGGTLLRRGVGFWQALIVTGVGAVLGAGLGLVPPVAFAATADNLDFAAPWLPLAVTALGMPLAVALGGWLLTRRHVPVVTRTAIG